MQALRCGVQASRPSVHGTRAAPVRNVQAHWSHSSSPQMPFQFQGKRSGLGESDGLEAHRIYSRQSNTEASMRGAHSAFIPFLIHWRCCPFQCTPPGVLPNGLRSHAATVGAQSSSAAPTSARVEQLTSTLRELEKERDDAVAIGWLRCVMSVRMHPHGPWYACECSCILQGRSPACMHASAGLVTHV